MPVADAADARRPSIVAELDPQRRLVALTPAVTIGEVVHALPSTPVLVAVDAPIAVPNERGRRDLDELLAWLDVPVLPAARARLVQLYGALRGEELRDALADDAGVELVEGVPDLVLRLFAWHTLPAPGTDLAEFRAAWLGLRPAPYRPKGRGRARPDAVASAYALTAQFVDFDGWVPGSSDDDFGAIADAAVIDAVLCAYSSWSAVHADAATVAFATAACVIPTVPLLAQRIAVNVQRMAAQGHDLHVRPQVAA